MILPVHEILVQMYLSHQRAVKGQMSMPICAVSPELSLLAHTKYGSR